MQDVFWINGKLPPHLAIVLRPRGDDWLEGELRRLKQQGIDTVVSMLEAEEAAQLGLTDERVTAEKAGLQFDSFPIPDRTTPAHLTAFRDFVVELASRLHTGERIGIHCRGSIGRATIAAACTLIHFGWSPQSALAAIESARGCQVPDTPEQLDWILRYEARK